MQGCRGCSECKGLQGVGFWFGVWLSRVKDVGGLERQ